MGDPLPPGMFLNVNLWFERVTDAIVRQMFDNAVFALRYSRRQPVERHRQKLSTWIGTDATDSKSPPNGGLLDSISRLANWVG